MSKQQKRERRKVDRARRSRRHAQAAGALAAGAAIAAGTQAYAAPVRFDNPAHGEADHFHWPIPGSSNDNSWLDITLPANLQQPNSYAPGKIRQTGYGFVGSSIALEGGYSLNTEVTSAFGHNYVVLPHNSGDPIPSGANWDGPFSPSVVSVGDVNDPYGGMSLLPGGEPTYLGVRFNTGMGMQYGWIGVVRNPGDGSVGSHWLEAFAWGYETDPGVPIAAGAPEPASLALLAFGAAAVIRRRRSA